MPVQHHHAHVVSCLVDAGVGRPEPTIGVAFDGTGCGPAGDLWGGEFLRSTCWASAAPVTCARSRSPAARRRSASRGASALAALLDAGLPDRPLLGAVDPASARGSAQLAPTALPRATGAGRWFDAVAALCGVRDAISYEGQAAIELEALASGASRSVPVRSSSR